MAHNERNPFQLRCDQPIDLAAAEALAAEHDAYLNVVYRVDHVCVAKDFPLMGQDLGETLSRRSYWEAEKRMDRIAADIGTGLGPPPTIGGFDVVIDQRMGDEWRFARMSGVLFDNIGLWIDEADATALVAEHSVDFPDHWRYEHSEGRGEIALDRHYERTGSLIAGLQSSLVRGCSSARQSATFAT